MITPDSELGTGIVDSATKARQRRCLTALVWKSLACRSYLLFRASEGARPQSKKSRCSSAGGQPGLVDKLRNKQQLRRLNCNAGFPFFVVQACPARRRTRSVHGTQPLPAHDFYLQVLLGSSGHIPADNSWAFKQVSCLGWCLFEAWSAV